jgi:Raf kinase inhibitor-like YbhB/YbcL family protein
MSKKIIVLIILVFIIIFLGGLVLATARLNTNKLDLKLSLPRIMQLHSNAFGNNQSIPSKYTCDDGNINPPLSITDVPAGAKSLVLIVNDPDAPSGNWIHWLVWNIDPSTREITESSVPEGATEGTNSFGQTSYGGPCPPSGTHRYLFNLYALDIVPDLSSDAKYQNVEVAMSGHIIDQATLIGLYQKGK